MKLGRLMLLAAVAATSLCGCTPGSTATPGASSVPPTPESTATTTAPPAATVPPSSIPDSYATYSGLGGELTAALEAKIPSVHWKVDKPTGILRQSDGRCLLFLPQYRSDPGLVAASDRFRAVMDAVNPVLEQRGFTRISGLDEAAEGYWSVSSPNSQGAQVTIAGRSDVALRVSVPVASEMCSTAEIQGLGS